MFRCALTELETIEISVATDGSSTVAQLPIGYETEPLRRYSLLVAFDTVPGRGRTCGNSSSASSSMTWKKISSIGCGTASRRSTRSPGSGGGARCAAAGDPPVD